MSDAYDPLRLPDGGRTVPCGLCERPVLLALDNPRRVCAACGNVNLPTPEAPSAVALGLPVERLRALRPGERPWGLAFFRQPPSLVIAWGSVGAAFLPLVFGVAVLGNELAGRGRREHGALLGAVVAALALGLPVLLFAALKRPPLGVRPLWRFVWFFVGAVLSAPVSFYLGLVALMWNWRS